MGLFNLNWIDRSAEPWAHIYLVPGMIIYVISVIVLMILTLPLWLIVAIIYTYNTRSIKRKMSRLKLENKRLLAKLEAE